MDKYYKVIYLDDEQDESVALCHSLVEVELIKEDLESEGYKIQEIREIRV